MIYFVACNDAVKIGTAADVRIRLNALQTANPDPLCLLGMVPGDEGLERALHRRFDDLRIRGEWFRNSGALAAFIADGFEDLPYRLFTADNEFFGLLGAPPYETSFYRAYVRLGDQWWRFQWDARASSYDPLERQSRILERARAETVHSTLGSLRGYTCDPTRIGLSRLFERVGAFGKGGT